jgi:hypothetical protein
LSVSWTTPGFSTVAFAAIADQRNAASLWRACRIAAPEPVLLAYRHGLRVSELVSLRAAQHPPPYADQNSGAPT